MKNLCYVFFMFVFFCCLLWLCASLQSCTATLRADKLWYNGNIARPVEYVVTPDSL